MRTIAHAGHSRVQQDSIVGPVIAVIYSDASAFQFLPVIRRPFVVGVYRLKDARA